jgi:hypothetical protein
MTTPSETHSPGKHSKPAMEQPPPRYIIFDLSGVLIRGLIGCAQHLPNNLLVPGLDIERELVNPELMTGHYQRAKLHREHRNTL